MVMNASNVNSNTMTLVYTAQNYVYVRMMNLEMYFKEVRRDLVHPTKGPSSAKASYSDGASGRELKATVVLPNEPISSTNIVHKHTV
jgi:hypothetical protein